MEPFPDNNLHRPARPNLRLWALRRLTVAFGGPLLSVAAAGAVVNGVREAPFWPGLFAVFGACAWLGVRLRRRLPIPALVRRAWWGSAWLIPPVLLLTFERVGVSLWVAVLALAGIVLLVVSATRSEALAAQARGQD
jgi:hypothetical protein